MSSDDPKNGAPREQPKQGLPGSKVDIASTATKVEQSTPPLSSFSILPITGITGFEPTGVLLHHLIKRNDILADAADELKKSLASEIAKTIREQAASTLIGSNNLWLQGLRVPPSVLSKTTAIQVESVVSGEVGKLREEIAKKEALVRQQEIEIGKRAEEVKKAIESKTATEAQLEEFRQASERQANELLNLQKRVDLSFILSRVNPAAYQRLISDEAFQSRFTKASACNAYVLAIDIRRSTELMLRAKTPELFADFLDYLCSRLAEAVKRHFGVVDKFTGDGLLAYFPDFFSGPDAAYLALTAAQTCHKVFDESYRANRHCFNVVLKDVGLGIGVDFGEVHLVRVTGELTAIGAPVVYACRLSGAPNGRTYLNPPAYAAASARLIGHLKAEETSFEVKHEGSIVCHQLNDITDGFPVALPDWTATENPQTK